MSRDSHAGFKLPLSAARLLELVSRDAAHRRPAILDWRMEGAAHRAPERHEHPLHSARILPGGHSAPYALGVERLIVVAQQRRGVEGRAVILAAERVAIEQPHAAFLARADEELASAVVERHRRDVDVEIARAASSWRCGARSSRPAAAAGSSSSLAPTMALPRLPVCGLKFASPVTMYTTPSGDTAAPRRPHMPPPAGWNVLALRVARWYEYSAFGTPPQPCAVAV